MPTINLDSEAFDDEEYVKLRTKYENTDMPDFKVSGKIIYKRTEFSNGEENESYLWKIWVPKELRGKVTYSAHNMPTSGHGGIARTLERIRRYFYWPGLVSDVRHYIQRCELCKTSKTPTTILKPPMGQMVETERPFQRLYVDIVGPLPRSKAGYVGILIILDHFSKFTFLKPLKKLVTKPIVDYMQSEIFNCFGVPEVVVSDNGSQFKSRFREISDSAWRQARFNCSV